MPTPTPAPTPTVRYYSGPNAAIDSVGPVETANVYSPSVLNANYVISTNDDFKTINVEYNPGSTQIFTERDIVAQIATPPGVNHKSWSVVAADGTRSNFDMIGFKDLPLTYLQLNAFYRKPPSVDQDHYTFITRFAAVSNAWTDPTAMPRTGSATYSGMSYGIAINPSAYRTTSQFQMAADFSSGHLSGNLSNFNFYDFATGLPASVSGTGLDLTFDATLNGSKFSDRIKISGVSAGRVEGQFAGPSAQEVGGSYGVMNADFSLFGVFAGKK
ncbi:transferrin-binding protein-like solute binding protein [Sphingomonas trueperi]|uniref:transferrin-binding protein-like solute binding protein n=1 Tax=Sphingomonas trueperi TaxID=53317 RepID=UPI001600341E